MPDVTTVWVFNGVRSNFPSGVFSSKNAAEEWIKRNGLSGTLTEYPLDISVYEWVISKGYFTPKREEQRSADFIQQFSSASQDHEHYTGGLSSPERYRQTEFQICPECGNKMVVGEKSADGRSTRWICRICGEEINI